MKANRPITSRSGKSPNDVVLTPNWIFQQLGLEFDLDPAHPPYKTNVPCKTYYTEEINGLEKDWFGLVWLNPPYSAPKKWIEKFIENNNGIALVPVAKSAWFNNLWNSASGVKLLASNFKFERNDGLRKDIFMPVCLVSYGEVSRKALENVDGSKVR